MATGQTDISALIDRVALGDRGAFDQLYFATSAKLFGVLLRILRNRAEAEDALQEVFVRIWNRADRFRAGGNSAMPWLIALTRNYAIDVLRARRPASDGLDQAAELADAGPTPEAATLAAAEAARLRVCLDQIPAPRAEAVQAAYIEGYTYQELAARYAVPLNTMRTWLRRSLQKLKACMEDG